jgi:hypothetical protein
MRLKWYQRVLCRIFCPRWKQDRPKDEPGTWIACALVVTHGGRYERMTREVEGLVNAYEVARWLALRLDFKTHPDLGIQWAIRKHENIQH